jgi:CopG family transcriptional regulator / antitoxin EndoAI
MMAVSTVNISFNSELLKEADRLAKAESRSRSELVREAVRQYIERRKKWDELFRLADQHMKGRNISEQDIIDEIHAYRREKRKKS